MVPRTTQSALQIPFEGFLRSNIAENDALSPCEHAMAIGITAATAWTTCPKIGSYGKVQAHWHRVTVSLVEGFNQVVIEAHPGCH